MFAKVWSVVRATMGVLIVAAIVAQLMQSIGSAVEAGRDVATVTVNFFSFFTILSNTGAATTLVWAALWFWLSGRRGESEPRALATVLAAVSTYMIVTGVVYNLLLRGYALEPGAVVPWSNEVLHLIGPLFVLVDLFVNPHRLVLRWSALWSIVAFPLLWVLYTMLRAPLITDPGTGAPYWYPYPFLNPNNAGGWPSVLLYIVGIACVILVVASVIVLHSRMRVSGRRDRGSVDATA